MPNGIGSNDQVLIQGRIVYGYDGTNANPFYANSTGNGMKKTVQTELVATQAIAVSTQVKSTELSLTGVKKVTFFIDHARAGSAAFATNGTEYRIEASQKATGDDTWRTVASVEAGSAVAMTCAASGNYAIGASTITILSGTAMTLGGLYFWPSGAAASCEWFKVALATGTASFTTLDALTNAHAAASAIVGSAEQFVVVMDTESLTRARVIVNNNNTGASQAIYSRVAAITET
jgi:hypothetical protein